ncbi:MAG: SurA N-terminal domain-containing protein [Bacteroidia bacterium]|nr:SurA N-terminal domain-containing protein [Bacteroidia bacterium]
MSNKYNNEEQSVLQKIQNQTGCLLLVIGIAMIAFVLTDLVSSGSSIFSSDENSVGEVAGKPLSYDEFNRTFEGLKSQLIQNNPGIAFDENMSKQYREQAWNMIIESRVVEPEYEKLALTVSPAELKDLTIGDNTHPQIQRSFRDPETNQFDKQRLIRFLKEDINANPEALQSWNSFQQQFTAGLIAQKYNQLIISSVYTTDLEAVNSGRDNNQTKNATIVSLPYNEFEDSTLMVSDSEILTYIKAHPAKYKEDANRDIEFIRLNVTPSREDSMDMMYQSKEIAQKFSEANDDSAFVSIMNSETPFNKSYQIRGSFPASVDDALFSASIGDVIGPNQENGVYSVYKITDTGLDSLPSIRGSHILINVAGTDTAKAERDARELIAQIKSGATTFEAEANNKNYDASRGKGGDMGWVRKDTRSYPRRLINRLFTSPQNQYFVTRSKKGVHIGKTTSKISRKTIQVAVVDQKIFPSTKTDGEYYKMAGEFLSKINGDKSFEEVAEELGLTKRVANKINENTLAIPGISNPNPIAKWLFNNSTKEGDISSIIDINGSYFVARVTHVKPDGLVDIEEVRTIIDEILLNEKKSDKLFSKLDVALNNSNTPEELAEKLETNPVSIPAASFSSSSIPYIGSDQIITGTIFGLPVVTKSEIIRGERALAVVYLNNDNEYEASDVEVLKLQNTDQSKQDFQQKVRQTIIENADVVDLRYRFYN